MSSSKSPSRSTKALLELPTRSDITLQLARGLELLRKHRWAHAIVALGSALELDPYEPKALEYRARCFMMLGQMNSALEDAERLVKVDKQRNAMHIENVIAQRERQQQMLMAQQHKQELKKEAKAAAAAANSGGESSDEEKGNSRSRGPSLSPALRGRSGSITSSARRLSSLSHPTTRDGDDGEFISGHHDDDDDDEFDDDDFDGKTRSVRFSNAAKKLIAMKRLMMMSKNNDRHDDDDEEDEKSKHLTEEQKKKLLDQQVDEYFSSPRQRKKLSPAERLKLSKRLSKATGSSEQRHRNHLDHATASTVGLTDEVASPTKNKSKAPIGSEIELALKYSPGIFGNKNKQQHQDGKNNAFGGSSNAAGNPKGYAAETVWKFSLQQSQQQNQNNNNATSSSYFGDDVAIFGSSNQKSSNGRLQHHRHRLDEGDDDGILSDGGKSNRYFSKTNTKYYQGILLRAQVLFAMGCFEDACRQFHEGFNLRPDVDEFRTGVTETEHILLGAVHPWRKRIAKPPAEELGALRANIVSYSPTSGKPRVGSAESRGSSSSSQPKNKPKNSKSKEDAIVNQKQSKPIVPRRPASALSSSADKNLQQCMPENSKDFFFLRQLRKHPRIFSTGLGPGINRDHGSSATIVHEIGRHGGRGSSRAGVGGRFANANDNHDYFLRNAESSAGPAQLAAFCVAAAIESAEEEALQQQNAQLLAQAESLMERTESERMKKQNPHHLHHHSQREQNNNNNNKLSSSLAENNKIDENNQVVITVVAASSAASSPTTKAHGMFGASALDDDDENSKKRRDFHIRPPDTRAWGVQSARGRRRMKDAVDTTLKYLETQQNFWAHRDERTSVPMFDESELPPRFKPSNKKLANYKSYNQAGANNNNNNNERKSVAKNNNNQSRVNNNNNDNEKLLNKIPLRPVTTASAETERQQLQEDEKRRRRASMAAVSKLSRDLHVQREQQKYPHHDKENNKNSNTELSMSSNSFSSSIINAKTTLPEKNKDKIPKAIAETNSEQEEDFFTDMHEVFKLMADQHKMRQDNVESSQIQFHRSQRNRQAFLLGGNDDGDNNNNMLSFANYSANRKNSMSSNVPKITSPDFTFIPQSHRDEVSSHVLAIPSDDAGFDAPAPVFVSDNLRFIHQEILQALSKGQAEVPFFQQQQQVGNSNNNNNKFSFSTSGVNMNNNKNSSQRRMIPGSIVNDDLKNSERVVLGGAISGDTSKKHVKNINIGTTEIVVQKGEDLARIQRALFDGGDEPYHHHGKKSSDNKNNNNAVGRSSPQKAVTLRWGEYDGLHMLKDDDDNDGDDTLSKNRRKSLASSKSNKNASHHASIEDAINRKHQERQFARHQRARALLAQNVQKELGVELPYEAIFRVPQRPSTSNLNNNSGNTNQEIELFQPFAAFGEDNDDDENVQMMMNTSKKGKNNARNNNNSPPQYRHGRNYATVSVKASPPQRAWNMKPDAVLNETRQQELARAAAIQKEKEDEIKEERRQRKEKKREKLRRKKERDEAIANGFLIEEEVEIPEEELLAQSQQETEDGEIAVLPERRTRIVRRYLKTIVNEDGDEEQVVVEENDDDDEKEDEDDDISLTDSDDQEAERNKKPPLTLEQVRAQYSKSTKQRLRRNSLMAMRSQQELQQHQDHMSSSSSSAFVPKSKLARNASHRAGSSVRFGNNDEIAANNYYDGFDENNGADDDDETSSSDDDFDEEQDNSNSNVFGPSESSNAFANNASGTNNNNSSVGRYENRLDDENASIAEAVSAAKALLEHGKRDSHDHAPNSPYFGFRPQTPPQQHQQRDDDRSKKSNNDANNNNNNKKKSSSQQSMFVLSKTKNPDATSSSSTVVPNRHETAAMKRLNATLRNISRLCSLGDVPLAIAIAAALVKELEAADSSLSGSGTTAHQHQRSSHSSSPNSGSSPSSKFFDQSNSVAAAFTTLAARLRCTLGALYLQISEGPAAVGELSRAVLLAKKAQQPEVYEQAVKLLGECYQTSGEEVDHAMEATNQPKRKRAASVVRI